LGTMSESNHNRACCASDETFRPKRMAAQTHAARHRRGVARAARRSAGRRAPPAFPVSGGAAVEAEDGGGARAARRWKGGRSPAAGGEQVRHDRSEDWLLVPLPPRPRTDMVPMAAPPPPQQHPKLHGRPECFSATRKTERPRLSPKTDASKTSIGKSGNSVIRFGGCALRDMSSRRSGRT